VVLTLAPACHRKGEGNGTVSSHATDPVQISSIQSRRDIERVLKTGMTTNEVLARMGPCSDIITFPDGALLWTYWLHPFREDGKDKGLYVLAARLTAR
jgi:hypothetical protein